MLEMVLSGIKNLGPVKAFKRWLPENCSCRLCGRYNYQVGLFKDTQREKGPSNKKVKRLQKVLI